MWEEEATLLPHKRRPGVVNNLALRPGVLARYETKRAGQTGVLYEFPNFSTTGPNFRGRKGSTYSIVRIFMDKWRYGVRAWLFSTFGHQLRCGCKLDQPEYSRRHISKEGELLGPTSDTIISDSPPIAPVGKIVFPPPSTGNLVKGAWSN